MTSTTKEENASEAREGEGFYIIKCSIPVGINICDIISILPKWETEIVNVRSTNEEDQPTVEVHFFIKASTITEFNSWRSDFEELNKVTYSVRSSEKGTGRYIHHKQRLKCQHNTQCARTYERGSGSQRMTKNTNCPSKIIVKIHAVKKYYNKENREMGEFKTRHPCEIVLTATHNHGMIGEDALRFRKVSDEIKNKLVYLFNCGHSPSTALETLKMEILSNHNNCNIILADRKFCPDYTFCKHLYSKEFKKKYGPLNFNQKGQDFLQTRLKTYNEEMKSNCAQMECDEQQNYVVCICTPLMKRIHKNIKEASETVLVDPSGTVNSDGSRVFILLTHSQCGGLPLGVIITSCEKAEILSRGFEILKTLVGNDIFYGNIEGPKIFLTDDSQSEQIAVNISFPKTRHLLCIFHVLQSVRSWLSESSNEIPQDLQNIYFDQFRCIMFAKNTNEAYEKFKEAESSAISHGNYTEYLQKCWDRKELWALAYRRDLLTDGNHTNNYSEAAMKIFKDKIFERVKAVNLIQLVNFILSKFSLHYERHLLDTANNSQVRNNIFGNEIKLPSPSIREKINILNDQVILVPSETSDRFRYLVDMAALTCTCFDGTKGKICKHMDWANFMVYSENYKAVDAIHFRKIVYTIATAQEPPENWLSSLHNTGNDTSSECDINNEGNECVNTEINRNFIKIQHNEAADEQDVQLKGTELITNISEIFTQFMKKSPLEAVGGLEKMYNNLSNIKTISVFQSACATFGKEYIDSARGRRRMKVQPTALNKRKGQDVRKALTLNYKKLKLTKDITV